jgi:holin-like protein
LAKHASLKPTIRPVEDCLMLFALATLLVFQCLGEGVSYLFGLPVPGPVIGMLLLLAFLVARPKAAEMVEPTALELLRHLSLLFVPAGVGIMVSASAVSGDLFAVVVSIAVSTTLAIAVTALVMRTLLRRSRKLTGAQERQS